MDMEKGLKSGPILRLRCLLLVGFFILLAGGSCAEKQQQKEDSPPWTPVRQKPRVTERLKKKISLKQIVFLDEVYRRFESLAAGDASEREKYAYNLDYCRVLKGKEHRKRKSLEIEGGDIVFSIDPDDELMRAKALEVLELDAAVNRNVEIKVFMVSQGMNPAAGEDQGYGDFILQKYVPAHPANKFATVFLDLSQRFGLEKRNVARLTIKITSVENEKCRVRIKGLRMVSRAVYLAEHIPSTGYYKYGGADRNWLKSVFLPAGSRITYLVSTQSNDPVMIEGHLGSVDNRAMEVELLVNDKLLARENLSGGLHHLKKEVVPENRKIRLSVKPTGEPGCTAILGNLRLYHRFSKRRNVVLYLVDALRGDKGGIAEELFEKEFKDGAVFLNAYSNATRTADSLPALFSAKYKFTLVDRDEEVPFLSNRELLLAEYFKTKGYTTAAFINNPWLALSNATQGFDYVNFCWDPIRESRPIPSPEDYHRRKYGKLKLFLESFARENADKPVFIYIHTMETHVPYEVPAQDRHYSKGASPEVLEKLYRHVTKSPLYPSLESPTEEELNTLKSLYKDAVLQASKYFTSVHDALYSQGILHDTSLLILTSDHGERFFEHKSWIHGPPDVYNEVLRIPLMMKGRDIVPGVYDRNVQLLDLYPTIMDWMGDEPLKVFPGKSLLEYMRVGPGPFDDRIIYADGTGNLPQYALVQNNLKAIMNGGKVELFDLGKDPGERVSLAGKSVYAGLMEEAGAFRKQFERSREKMRGELTAEERERLRSLGRKGLSARPPGKKWNRSPGTTPSTWAAGW